MFSTSISSVDFLSFPEVTSFPQRYGSKMLQNLCHFRLFPYSSKKGHLPVWKCCACMRKYSVYECMASWTSLLQSNKSSLALFCLSPQINTGNEASAVFCVHIHTLPQPGPPSILSKSPILCFLAPVKAASITSLPPAYVLGGLHALTVGWLYVGYVGLFLLTPCLKTMLFSLPTSKIPSAADRSLGIAAFRGLGNKVANKRDDFECHLLCTSFLFFTCVVYFSWESLFYFDCQLASLGSDLF